jgi:putative aminopeptidase FrvX
MRCQGRCSCFNAQAVPVPDLLRSLLVACGPSGHEEEPTRIWREAAAFAELSSDTLGTSYARVRAGDGAPTLAVVGHIDEIGVAITNIDEDGLLSFTTVGGIGPETLHGQRFELLTANGRIPAAVARKRLYPEQMRDRKPLELSDLHLDIGASSREQAEELVRVGDAGVWGGVPTELPNGRLLSKGLDNRLGAYVALEVARRVAEAGDAKIDVVAVAAVQEEIGTYGARAAAFGLDPDIALVVDVSPATDVPGGNPKRAGAIDLGMGAMIARGPTLNKKLADLLADTATADGIAHGFEVYSRTTQTDADEFHLARAGIPTGLLSVPTRYVHTPNELCDLADVEAVIAVITAVARRITPDISFLR